MTPIRKGTARRLGLRQPVKRASGGVITVSAMPFLRGESGCALSPLPKRTPIVQGLSLNKAGENLVRNLKLTLPPFTNRA